MCVYVCVCVCVCTYVHLCMLQLFLLILPSYLLCCLSDITVYIVVLSVCLSSAHAQCRDISSEDQRALMLGQRVCFQCPLGNSNITWTFQTVPTLPTGAEGFDNGTLLITSVAEAHLEPGFFQCGPGGQESDRYRLVLACKYHFL